jgi:hypothetical protein
MDLSLKLRGVSSRVGGTTLSEVYIGATCVLVRLVGRTLERWPKLEARQRISLRLTALFHRVVFVELLPRLLLSRLLKQGVAQATGAQCMEIKPHWRMHLATKRFPFLMTCC